MERRRRIERAVKLIPGEVFTVEIYSHETFHRGTSLFGIACSPRIVEKLLTEIREHRAEISIDKKYLRTEQIREDTKTMIREDIDNILSCEPGEHESWRYLVERYREVVLRDIPKESLEDVEKLFNEGREQADSLDKNKEIDGEIKEADRISELYPKETNLPIQESMRRRSKNI